MKRWKPVLLIVAGCILAGGTVAWFYFDPEERKIGIQAFLLELERPVYHFLDLWESERVPESDLPDSASVYQAVVDGANWIVNMQEESGRFNYWYNVETKTFSNPYQDNFLRQAGTCYSLLPVYELTGNRSYLEASKKSINYQLTHLEKLDDDKAYFLFRRKAKLGGIALPMMSLLRIRKLENDTTNDTTLRHLANMILYLQDLYGTGQFKSTYVYRGNYEHEKESGWESEIYPGEAMLALAFMYQQFPEPEYKEAFDKAVAFYYTDEYDWESGPFIPWTVSACVEMYEASQEQVYLDFAFDMMESDFYWQNMNPSRDAVGSQFGYPTVFTSTSQEALGDMIRLLRLLGKEEKMEEYTYRAKIAYKWLLSLQYRGKDEHGYGGFATSPIDSEIRIDNTQHAISALTKGLWYVY